MHSTTSYRATSRRERQTATKSPVNPVMSAHPTPQTDDETDPLQTLPTFGLTCMFDEEEDPETVTVFCDEDDRITTEWITFDRRHAVALEDVA